MSWKSLGTLGEDGQAVYIQVSGSLGLLGKAGEDGMPRPVIGRLMFTETNCLPARRETLVESVRWTMELGAGWMAHSRAPNEPGMALACGRCHPHTSS